MFVDGDDRRRLSHQTSRGEARHHGFLYGDFADRTTCRNRLSDPGEGFIDDRSERSCRALMAGELVAGQRRLKALNEIGRGDDLDSHRADDFDRARIDARDVRNRAPGRMVHRDSPRAAEHGAQGCEHLVVRTIDDLLDAERVEPMRLDG